MDDCARRFGRQGYEVGLRGANKELKRLSLLLLVLLLHTTHALAELADTETWNKVKARMNGDTGYSLRADYRGPEGHFLFRYIVQGAGDRILTEVLEGSSRGVGTRIYYDPERDKENVTMQTSMFRLRRSLESRDLKNSPVHKPLFAHLLDELGRDPSEVDVRPPGNMIFMFGDKAAVHEFLTVDAKGNPVRLTRMEANKEISRLTFDQLEWGLKPIDWD